MDDLVKKLFENKTVEEISNMLINFNRFQLNRKDHIKKYNRLRKLHSEVLNSMENYILSGKYDIRKYDDIVNRELIKVVDNFDIDFNLNNADDVTVFFELFVYNNHPNIPSVTDIYLKNRKFKNQEKTKMLECMKNSYAGLFKIIDIDRNNGYVTYQDVFTNKKFKIIDIAMSSTLCIDKKRDFYTYNRIITYDDISFATGIHCHFSSECKPLMKFIKTHNYKKCSGFIRCLLLYDICKKDSSFVSNYNHQYGYR